MGDTADAIARAYGGEEMKAFTGQIGKTINSLNEYGCWCYLYDDHGRGKGVPVDVIDEMCKTLADGYECAAANEGNNCAIRACIVEGAFIANLLDVFASGGSIDDSLRHENGFDVATSCPIKISSKAPGEKQCCGNYPNRFPFKTTGGDRRKNFYNRQCCGTRTYNANNMKCCNAESSSVKFNC